MVFLNVPSFELLLPTALGSWSWTGQMQPDVCGANLPQHNCVPDHVKSLSTAAESLSCNKPGHTLGERASPKVSAGGMIWVNSASSSFKQTGIV